MQWHVGCDHTHLHIHRDPSIGIAVLRIAQEVIPSSDFSQTQLGGLDRGYAEQMALSYSLESALAWGGNGTRDGHRLALPHCFLGPMLQLNLRSTGINDALLPSSFASHLLASSGQKLGRAARSIGGLPSRVVDQPTTSSIHCETVHDIAIIQRR